MDFLRYHQLKSSIISLQDKLITPLFNHEVHEFSLPRLPLLLKIGLQQVKGCSFFYRVIQSSPDKLRLTTSTELKWHNKLGTVFSDQYWNKIYSLPPKSLVPNKLIWTQVQINRYLLPTNYTVSHYDLQVSPLCSFCRSHNEELHLLYLGCEAVQEFWTMVSNVKANFFPKITLRKKEYIFGDSASKGDSVVNTILILARYFIYQQKFLTKKLDEVAFIIFIQKNLEIIYQSKKLKNKHLEFAQEWGEVLDHFQIVPDISN